MSAFKHLKSATYRRANQIKFELKLQRRRPKLQRWRASTDSNGSRQRRQFLVF